MSVSLSPAFLPTVLIAYSCPMTTNVSASLASQVRHLRTIPILHEPSSCFFVVVVDQMYNFTNYTLFFRSEVSEQVQCV